MTNPTSSKAPANNKTKTAIMSKDASKTEDKKAYRVLLIGSLVLAIIVAIATYCCFPRDPGMAIQAFIYTLGLITLCVCAGYIWELKLNPAKSQISKIIDIRKFTRVIAILMLASILLNYIIKYFK